MSSNGLANGYGIYGNGSDAGTSANPWAINDFEDLQAISSDNWGTDKYYQQTADITLTTNVTISGGFLGDYFGNGYCIDGDNLYAIKFSGDSAVGKIHELEYRNLFVSDGRDGSLIRGSSFTISNFIMRNCNLNDSISTGCSLVIYHKTLGKNINMENVMSYNFTGVGASIYAGRTHSPFVIYSPDWTSGVTHKYTNVVGVNSNLTGGNPVQIGTGPTLVNCYATNGGTSTSGVNGLNITSTQYNSQSWWQNTALYDFSETGAWEWDDDNNLPKLKHVPIVNIKVKVNGTWHNGIPYNKVNGAWKEAKSVYVKINGVWKQQS